PQAGSGHSYSASEYMIPISLMLYGGGESIEDVREIRGDAPLRKVSGLTGIPGVSAMGDWLRRMGGRSGVNFSGTIIAIIVWRPTCLNRAMRKLSGHIMKEHPLRIILDTIFSE
ncbi:MAG: IS1380 family transposase, partial [Smithella sp.]